MRSFARRVVEGLAEEHPDELTVELRKTSRKGRLYLDVGRNAHGQTALAPYSLRPLPGAPVATPLTWDEFRRTRSPQRYTLKTIRSYLERNGDP